VQIKGVTPSIPQVHHTGALVLTKVGNACMGEAVVLAYRPQDGIYKCSLVDWQLPPASQARGQGTEAGARRSRPPPCAPWGGGTIARVNPTLYCNKDCLEPVSRAKLGAACDTFFGSGTLKGVRQADSVHVVTFSHHSLTGPSPFTRLKVPSSEANGRRGRRGRGHAAVSGIAGAGITGKRDPLDLCAAVAYLQPGAPPGGTLAMCMDEEPSYSSNRRLQCIQPLVAACGDSVKTPFGLGYVVSIRRAPSLIRRSNHKKGSPRSQAAQAANHDNKSDDRTPPMRGHVLAVTDTCTRASAPPTSSTNATAQVGGESTQNATAQVGGESTQNAPPQDNETTFQQADAHNNIYEIALSPCTEDRGTSTSFAPNNVPMLYIHSDFIEREESDISGASHQRNCSIC